MRTLLALTSACVAAVALTAAGPVAAPRCADCHRARFWNVPADAWRDSSAPVFPETARLTQSRPYDLGVAFSGGGTRSAAATLGQLRGLRANGWLPSVRYMTAVSGGAWAAVPFTFASNLDGVLGPMQAPGELTQAVLQSVRPRSLASAIAGSKLSAVGIREAIDIAASELGGDRIRSLVERVRGADVRRDRTYSRMLGRIFIEPLVPRGTTLPFTWDIDERLAIQRLNPDTPPDFLRAEPAERPFLIVGGTMIHMQPAFDYPRLIPVEYTPQYIGVRQEFNERLGGTYVWPWAYNAPEVAEDEEPAVVRVRARPDAGFTLADVIASTGAAPQLALFLGSAVPPRFRQQLQQGAGFFPHFSHYAVRSNVPGSVTAGLPHGDGGFTDNLGLMPLLARQVRNILVFVNSNKDYDHNDQLQSYFQQLQVRDGSGDKSMNAVFDEARYAALIRHFDEQAPGNRPPVYCGRDWRVAANELYNIAAYDGLNICWVYNRPARGWEEELHRDGQHLLGLDDGSVEQGYEAFPWYDTFGQNKPRVIQLTAPQVNLLASLTSWIVTNGATRAYIAEHLGLSAP